MGRKGVKVLLLFPKNVGGRGGKAMIPIPREKSVRSSSRGSGRLRGGEGRNLNRGEDRE